MTGKFEMFAVSQPVILPCNCTSSWDYVHNKTFHICCIQLIIEEQKEQNFDRKVCPFFVQLSCHIHASPNPIKMNFFDLGFFMEKKYFYTNFVIIFEETGVLNDGLSRSFLCTIWSNPTQSNEFEFESCCLIFFHDFMILRMN